MGNQLSSQTADRLFKLSAFVHFYYWGCKALWRGTAACIRPASSCAAVSVTPAWSPRRDACTTAGAATGMLLRLCWNDAGAAALTAAGSPALEIS